jgi:hypothetical protein
MSNIIPSLEKSENLNFRQFLIETSQTEKDIHETLRKLPKSHQKLIHGYKFNFQPGNTLKGDNSHVGVIDGSKKSVIISSPWNFPREWVFLHELAHLIWMDLSKEKRKEWEEICRQTKLKKGEKDIPEELFCHSYSSTYCTNKVTKYNYPKWENFIKKL